MRRYLLWGIRYCWWAVGDRMCGPKSGVLGGLYCMGSILAASPRKSASQCWFGNSAAPTLEAPCSVLNSQKHNKRYCLYQAASPQHAAYYPVNLTSPVTNRKRYYPVNHHHLRHCPLKQLSTQYPLTNSNTTQPPNLPACQPPH